MTHRKVDTVALYESMSWKVETTYDADRSRQEEARTVEKNGVGRSGVAADHDLILFVTGEPNGEH